MKMFFMIFVQLVFAACFLNAQPLPNSSVGQQTIIVNSKKNKVDLIKKEWRRGYEKGFADAQAGKSYNDTDTVASAKQIPTSEAFQNGYREGYQQGKRF